MYYVYYNHKNSIRHNFVTLRNVGHMTFRCEKREPLSAPFESLDKNLERGPHSALDGVPPFTRLWRKTNEKKTTEGLKVISLNYLLLIFEGPLKRFLNDGRSGANQEQ